MVSLYEFTFPTMIRGLQTLKIVLAKAQAKEGFDINALPECRLAEDMFPFTFQIQTACNTAKSSVWRLGKSGEDVHFPDDEKTVDQLIARLDKTIELLEAFKPEDMKADADNVKFKVGSSPPMDITAKEYVLDYAIPNFFFHVQTAYCILRMKGVDIGKRDYLAPFMKGHMPS